MAPKQIFKDLVIAFSGDFGDGGGHSNKTHAHLSGWVTLHGGQVVPDVTPQTTHLICSMEDYEKKSNRMRKAKALGKKQCRIVTYEWIEESLIPRKKLQPTETYEHDYKEKERRRMRKEKSRSAEDYGKQIVSTINLVDPNLYHHYHDNTGFRLAIVLTKVTMNTKKNDGRFLKELYTIYIFESNCKPHLYRVGTRLKIGARKPAWGYEYCYDMEFDKAFRIFRRLFKKETGIDWDKRLDGIKMAPNLKRPEGYYIYTPPPANKPRGEMPLGWVDPAVLRAMEISNTTDNSDTTGESSGSEESNTTSAVSDISASSDGEGSGTESSGSHSSSGKTRCTRRDRVYATDQGDGMVPVKKQVQGWTMDVAMR